MKVLKACARVQATITYSPIYSPSSLSSQLIVFFCFQHSIFSTIPTLVSIIDNFIIKRLLSGPLDCKEIQPVHSEGDQPWDFFGRNDAEAETPVLWPPHVKS